MAGAGGADALAAHQVDRTGQQPGLFVAVVENIACGGQRDAAAVSGIDVADRDVAVTGEAEVYPVAVADFMDRVPADVVGDVEQQRRCAHVQRIAVIRAFVARVHGQREEVGDIGDVEVAARVQRQALRVDADETGAGADILSGPETDVVGGDTGVDDAVVEDAAQRGAQTDAAAGADVAQLQALVAGERELAQQRAVYLAQLVGVAQVVVDVEIQEWRGDLQRVAAGGIGVGIADDQVGQRFSGIVDVDVTAAAQRQVGGGRQEVVAGCADVSLGLEGDVVARQRAIGIGAHDAAALRIEPERTGARIQHVGAQVRHAGDVDAVAGLQVVQQHRALGLVEIDTATRGVQDAGGSAQVGARGTHRVAGIGGRGQQRDDVAGDERGRGSCDAARARGERDVARARADLTGCDTVAGQVDGAAARADVIGRDAARAGDRDRTAIGLCLRDVQIGAGAVQVHAAGARGGGQVGGVGLQGAYGATDDALLSRQA